MARRTDLLVQLDPGEVALAVRVLEAEEPYFPQADGLHNLVKQLFAGCRLLDGELQLRIHRRHPHIHLQQKAQS